ncbi:MAG: toll/interleukin-1 receptor domain-containing protein [Myxococcales bacterium]|nr:toll/interleukin-1 receptor domain-containing protein [Myxococcales bacterium]
MGGTGVFGDLGLGTTLSRIFCSKCLMPGDEWELELPRALAGCRACVVFVSRRIENTRYTREEIALSITLKRDPNEVHRTISVYLDGTSSDLLGVPRGLRHLHGIDAIATEWPDCVAQELLEAAQQLPPGAAPQSLPLAFEFQDFLTNRVECFQCKWMR